MKIRHIKAKWTEPTKKEDTKIEEEWCCEEAERRISIHQTTAKPFIVCFEGYGATVEVYIDYCPFCGEKIKIEEIQQNKPIKRR